MRTPSRRVSLIDGTDHIKRVDDRMARVVGAVGECRLPRRRGAYASIVRSIVGQQVSSKAATAIHGRVRRAAGGWITPERIGALSDPALRDCGLSRQKITYVRDLTSRVIDGSLALDRLRSLPDEAVIERLTEVKGLGLWSAQMFLMFVLNRGDVLPTGDLGIRNGFRRLYGFRRRPAERTMRRIAEPWRPYRTIGAWYLWRSLEITRSNDEGARYW